MTMDCSGHVDFAYLDEAAQVLSAAKRRTYELMELQAGHRVLDLGCGPGSDTIALADLVGDAGEVHGADFAVDDLGVFSRTFVLDRVLDSAEAAGALTSDEVRHFYADLEHAAEIGGFFASVQQLLVTGRKPDVTASWAP